MMSSFPFLFLDPYLFPLSLLTTVSCICVCVSFRISINQNQQSEQSININKTVCLNSRESNLIERRFVLGEKRR